MRTQGGILIQGTRRQDATLALAAANAYRVVAAGPICPSPPTTT
jgi:hypothetical protein